MLRVGVWVGGWVGMSGLSENDARVGSWLGIGVNRTMGKKALLTEVFSVCVLRGGGGGLRV